MANIALTCSLHFFFRIRPWPWYFGVSSVLSLLWLHGSPCQQCRLFFSILPEPSRPFEATSHPMVIFSTLPSLPLPRIKYECLGIRSQTPCDWPLPPGLLHILTPHQNTSHATGVAWNYECICMCCFPPVHLHFLPSIL